MKSLLLLLLIVPTITCAENTCGGTYRGFQYTIASPNYPQDYPNAIDCFYTLEGEPSNECEQEFHLQFLDFNLRPTENCKGDYLLIGDRNLFCGYTVGLRKYKGTNNTLSIAFHSDDRDTAKGFKILVTALPCSLKLNPLKDSPIKGAAEESRSRLTGKDAFGDYQREVRGGNTESDATRISLLPKNIVFVPTPGDSSGIDFSREGSSAIGGVEASRTASSNGGDALVSSYLFLPPNEMTRGSFVGKNKDLNGIGSPSNELLPPSDRTPIAFSRVRPQSSASDKSSSSSLVQRVAVPARNYGEPGAGFADYDLQLANDCDKSNPEIAVQTTGSEKLNYDPQIGSGLFFNGNFDSSSQLIYDPKLGFASLSNNYGYPGSYYSGGIGNPSIYNPGVISNPSINYPEGTYNPSIDGSYYSNGAFPNYPTGSYSGGGIFPEYNTGFNPVVPNYNPSWNSITPGLNPSLGGDYYPNYGNGWNNGFVDQNGECCRSPTGRRFSIVSPGFPGSASSGNSYSCRYTVIKSSPDVCRLSLKFRFFNFGSDDPYCSYGYVEVDGRRYCGCRTGENAQLLFSDYIAKTINVYHAGYPRSKLSGFLIDVVQEGCGTPGSYNPYQSYSPYNTAGSLYPGYPSYIKRRSVEANSTTEENASSRSVLIPSPVDPNPHIRSRRDLGYAYPKPNAPLFDKGLVGGKTHDRIFGGSCQNRLFLDWAIAAKEAFFKNARCLGGLNGRRGSQPPLDVAPIKPPTDC